MNVFLIVAFVVVGVICVYVAYVECMFVCVLVFLPNDLNFLYAQSFLFVRVHSCVTNGLSVEYAVDDVDDE